jgi:hypothetical protein
MRITIRDIVIIVLSIFVLWIVWMMGYQVGRENFIVEMKSYGCEKVLGYVIK